MGAKSNDSAVDRLFQLPLDQFTAARNALAKETGAAEIRRLPRPPLAAWAVNQLYWRERDVFTALIAAAEGLRKTHRAALAGRAGDLRAASRAHDQALDRAVKATVAILADAGHPASNATRQAVVSTLRALPAGDTPGRLTETLQPGGFEALAGVPIAPRTTPAPAAKKEAGASKAEKARDAKALAREKEAARAAAAARQRAEHEARREEFERARAVRDAEKAAAAVERAREAVRQAEQELEEAERTSKAANANRERAERRAKEAEAKLAALEA